MSERTFIDTNVFVYAEDADEPEKRKIAQRLIQELTAAGLMSHLDVVLIRSEHVLGAVDLASMYSLSSWDALILKTASTSGCGRLLTEDMQDGQVIDGVRIDNPFS
jgi:predicted nucleic acid-binding protein